MHETVAFDLAVKTAFEMTSREDTLIIVTADHGHTMTMSGYQSRGSDIRGTMTEGRLTNSPYTDNIIRIISKKVSPSS